MHVVGLVGSTLAPVETYLDCDAALRVDPRTLRPLTPDEQRYWDTERDAGVRDAGRPDLDAGLDASVPEVDAGDPDAPEEPARGGACAIGHRDQGAPWAVLLVALALVVARRRR